MGMYDGKLLNEEVRAFVEGCDCVINLGGLLTDVSSGAFTANLDPRKTIHVMHHHVQVGFATYNDLAQWNYAALPAALGCEDWFAARVNTCGELDEAINRAETCGTGAYIEVVADKYMASPLSQKMHESIDTLYA